MSTIDNYFVIGQKCCEHVGNSNNNYNLIPWEYKHINYLVSDELRDIASY